MTTTQPIAVGYVRVSTKLDEQTTSPATPGSTPARPAAAIMTN